MLDQLDRRADTVVTSTRLPRALHEAVRIAVELGMDSSANDATNRALRDRLDVFAQRLALDAHHRAHPGTRPSLAELARAAALLDGDPLADEPDLLEQAAREVGERWPDATGDDVLVYASALARHGRRRPRRSPAA